MPGAWLHVEKTEINKRGMLSPVLRREGGYEWDAMECVPQKKLTQVTRDILTGLNA